MGRTPRESAQPANTPHSVALHPENCPSAGTSIPAPEIAPDKREYDGNAARNCGMGGLMRKIAMRRREQLFAVELEMDFF